MAGTTGTINGTVTDQKTGTGLAGVTVTAVSATGKYTGKTDAKGFYAFTGVSADTYTVSFELSGFQAYSATGVNVFADGIATVSVPLSKSLVTIGRVSARSQTGAYQPNQTQDTYTVSSSQIDTQLGKKDSVSETNLIVSLPGASRDSSGYPVIRGGRENEEGFQYEGIPYTDAFTNQFVNSLSLNGGVAQLQLTPGAGDASSGNNGTGTLNLVAKRGTYPGFGQVEVETNVFPYYHQLQLEYGFATPNGAISNYFSYLGSRGNNQYGARTAAAASVGAFYGTFYTMSNDLLDNFVFKFGRDQNQSLQLFYQNQQINFYTNYGGIDGLFFKSNDPFAIQNYFTPYTAGAANQFNGLTTGQIQQTIALDPYQTSPTQPLGRRTTYYQPNDSFKVQYSNNINSSTFLTAKYYKVNAVTTFDFPYYAQTYDSFVALQGGLSTGFTLDITKQLNSKNLIKVGASSAFLHPVYNQYDGPLGFLAAGDFGTAGAVFGLPEVSDFLPTSQGGTGYLAQFFPNGVPRVPADLEVTGTNRQDYAFYLNDTFSPSDRLKFDFGVRFDGANYRLPSAAPCNKYDAAGNSLDDPAFGGSNQCLYQYNSFDSKGNPIVTIDPQAKNPLVVEPRAAFSLQITKNDAVRFSYGRSAEFATLGAIDLVTARSLYLNQFGNIPVNPNGPGAICGVTGTRTCASYGDQLYWENQNNNQGVPIQPAKPETFNNFDFSYSHQFAGNVGLKVTPFYRRGYNAVAQVASPRLGPNGLPVLNPDGSQQFLPAVTTNLGNEYTTGLEFLVTKDAAYGLSGSFSATYLNEFSNVPPLSTNEDFYPTIPPASLALGNLYRVGFLSPFQATLAVAYKTHGGFKVNPVISYNKGYPIGAGLLTSTFVNGKPFNVPNTNVTSPNGSTGTQQYVDPQNPGAITKPNIDATRGGALGPSAGSVLSNARFNTNLDFEYSPPTSKSTFGVDFLNLFGNVYGLPALNSRYQPVASGISGPKSGYSALPILYPGIGYAQYSDAARFGNQAFLITPNGAPLTVRLYYSLNL